MLQQGSQRLRLRLPHTPLLLSVASKALPGHVRATGEMEGEVGAESMQAGVAWDPGRR